MKKLPIGQSNFEALIEENNYYIDKSLFIKDIIDSGSTFTLCTRPRRFGKTLNQTMLKCFFEDTAPLSGESRRALFNGLNIEAAGEKYMAHQGKYPVIYLSFKDAGRDTFANSAYAVKNKIATEFVQHRYIFESIPDNRAKVLFEKLASFEASDNEYSTSIEFLSHCLTRYHKKKTIVLIDEYDVPLENAWRCGFYSEMSAFVRSLMGSALKDNDYLQFAVVTGCLRISKESIFTGLNNLDVISIMSYRYGEHFGFSQSEMDDMLEYYGLAEKTQIIKDWYDGYLFGNSEVYNPWSAINCVNDWAAYSGSLPKPYWSNTSGNDLIRHLIENAGSDVKSDLETLMEGGTISKKIHEDITYAEVDVSSENLWNFLLFTGYLKKVSERLDDVETIVDLSIPNLEIKYIYKTKIQEWFNKKIKEGNFKVLYKALLSGDAAVVKDELSRLLLHTMSYMDGKEDFYHGMLLGVLAGMSDYVTKSNRETGSGRCDIVVKYFSNSGKAVFVEVKWLKQAPGRKVTADALKKECDDALEQIKDGNYTQELQAEGYTDIIKYAIAFCGKNCEVKVMGSEGRVN